MSRRLSVSGRPKYVFQAAHPSAHKTTPWYCCSHRLQSDHRFHLDIITFSPKLFEDDGATLDDLREAVTTLEDAERTARRVLGGGQPTAVGMEQSLRQARAVLSAREGDLEPLRAAVEAMAPGDA